MAACAGIMFWRSALDKLKADMNCLVSANFILDESLVVFFCIFLFGFSSDAQQLEFLSLTIGILGDNGVCNTICCVAVWLRALYVVFCAVEASEIKVRAHFDMSRRTNLVRPVLWLNILPKGQFYSSALTIAPHMPWLI